MTTPKKSDTLGPFEQLVLTAVVTLRERAYGVPIHAKVSELAERAVNLGSVRVTLDRLQDKGYVSSWLADPTPERGGKSKRYFRLEPAGLAALQEAIAMSHRMSEACTESWRIGKWKPRHAK